MGRLLPAAFEAASVRYRRIPSVPARSGRGRLTERIPAIPPRLRERVKVPRRGPSIDRCAASPWALASAIGSTDAGAAALPPAPFLTSPPDEIGGANRRPDCPF